MKNSRLLWCAALVLALASSISAALYAEPGFVSVSVSQTVTTTTLAANTKSVLIVSDGTSTCYFRLFTDVDTTADATTSSAPLKSGEKIGFTFAYGDSQYVAANGAKASYYKTLSSICATGQTATWRVYAQ